MFYAVYKSSKKADTYLYIAKKDDFGSVPAALLESFGKPQFVLVANAKKRSSLAGIEISEFIEKFNQQGFYLQLPPKAENLLDKHRHAKKG